MKGLVKEYSAKLRAARRRAAAPKDIHDKYAVITCKREFIHYLHQQHRDYNRRGFSNREGRENRSYRKHNK